VLKVETLGKCDGSIRTCDFGPEGQPRNRVPKMPRISQNRWRLALTKRSDRSWSRPTIPPEGLRPREHLNSRRCASGYSNRLASSAVELGIGPSNSRKGCHYETSAKHEIRRCRYSLRWSI